MAKSSVIIVGAGVIGVTTAYELEKTGRYQIKVIDDNPAPAGGCSKAAAGILCVDLATTHSGKGWWKYLYKVNYFQAYRQEGMGNWLWHFLKATRNSQNSRYLQQLAEESSKLTLPLLAKMDLKIFYPFAQYPRDAVADCQQFTGNLLKNVEFIGNSPVKKVIIEQNHISGVELFTGEIIPSDHVVLCTATGTNSLLKRSNLPIVPIIPVKGYSLTSISPLKTIYNYDDDNDQVIVPFGDGRIRIAGHAEITRDNRPDYRVVTKMLEKKDFPPSKFKVWTGLRPLTPDDRPLIGNYKVPGLWLNTGHGALGWTLACVSAKILRQNLENSQENQLCHPERFSQK